MYTHFKKHEDAAFEHRLAMLAASFTASSPIARPSRTELLSNDRAFLIERSTSLGTRLRRVRDRVVFYWRRRAAIAELRALSDSILDDIGLPRHLIVQAVDQQLRAERDGRPLPVNAERRDAWRAPAALREAGNAGRFEQAA